MERYCIIGYPLKHSVSPEMHNSAFRYFNIDAEYIKLEVKPDELDKKILEIKESYSGGNVTIPYKEAVAKYFEPVGDAAKVGAVNTIDFKSKKAYNTDVYGALKAIETKIPEEEFQKMIAIVAGAGGAAKAISYGLLKKGCKVIIHNRTPERGLKLVDELRGYGKIMFVRDDELKQVKADLIVNATPLGMVGFEDVLPVPESLLNNVVVFDTVYNPLETSLIKKAKENGCEVIYGIEMLIHQAIRAFEIWKHIRPPEKVMKDAALRILRG
jgi:shikimate dehydrogenase